MAGNTSSGGTTLSAGNNTPTAGALVVSAFASSQAAGTLTGGIVTNLGGTVVAGQTVFSPPDAAASTSQAGSYWVADSSVPALSTTWNTTTSGKLSVTIASFAPAVTCATPTVQNVGGSTTVCQGGSASVYMTNSQSGVTYQLYANSTPSGATVSGDGSMKTWSVSPASTTTYTVQSTMDGGYCGALMNGSAVITVNSNSADPTSASASPNTVHTGGPSALTLTGGGGGGASETIVWYKDSCGGTLVGTGNNLVVNPTSMTTYYGRYEDGAPCNYNSACASVTVTVNDTAAVPTMTYRSNSWLTANPTTLTSPFTFTPDSNGMLVVIIGGKLGTATDVTVTWAGVPMTPGPVWAVVGSGNSVAGIWYLMDLSSGSGDLVITWTGGTIQRFSVDALYATGVTQGAPEWTAGNTSGSGGGTTLSAGNNVPTAGALVVSAFASSQAAGTLTGGIVTNLDGTVVAGQPVFSPPDAAASTSQAGSYWVADSNAPALSTTWNTTTSGKLSVAIASFAPAAACTPTVQNVGGSTAICSGGSATVYMTNSQSGVTYQLYANGTPSGGTVLGDATQETWSVNPASTTIYTVQATTNGGYCEIAMNGSAVITVYTNSADPTSASASPNAVYSGSPSVLTLTGGGGGGASETIIWYKDSCGGTLVGTGNNWVVNPTSMTTYYGRYEDGAPCNYNSACASVTVTVIAPPVFEAPALIGTNLSLSWSGGGFLLESTNILGPWITNGATSPAIIPIDRNVPQKLFRVQQ
jgi:hypothetical protein